jgi:hypothetical protein
MTDLPLKAEPPTMTSARVLEPDLRECQKPGAYGVIQFTGLTVMPPPVAIWLLTGERHLAEAGTGGNLHRCTAAPLHR